MSKAGASIAARSASAASAEWRFPNRATPPGSSAYYSVRMSRASRRDALAALFAWRAELRAILEQVSDPGVARIKLDWWRSELERILAGEPRHPLSEVLAPVVAEQQLPEQPFIAIIAGVERALQNQPHPDPRAQRRAGEQDLGALFELLACCDGACCEGACRDEAAGEQARAQARRAGGWCAQVRRIRDAGLLLRQGREVLPSEQLAAAGLSQDSLASADGRQRLAELLRPLAEELRAASLDAGLCEPVANGRPRETDRGNGFTKVRSTRTQRAMIGLTPAVRVQLRLHQDLLTVLERSGFDVADQRIGLTPLRKLWLAWRVSH